jgi:hypothetical protein
MLSISFSTLNRNKHRRLFVFYFDPKNVCAQIFGEMADFLNLPQATNIASRKSKMFIPITDDSPTEILKKIASSIMTATPVAAKGVRCGLMRSREGSIKPMLTIISEMPINLTGNELTSFVHGISAYKFSIGKVLMHR